MIIDGKKIAQDLINVIAKKTAKLPRAPGLAVILVGDDPASVIYVRNKDRACKKVGFYAKTINLPANITQQQLLSEIGRLNQNPKIDGILVQLPLPEHLDSSQVIEKIDPAKDVDGFHSQNIGKLMQNKPFLRPCTPKGVMTLLATLNIGVIGKNCVVVGASNIVGRPMAIELLNAGATVTICNSKTQNLSDKIKHADMIVVAIGVPKMIKGDWIRNGAIVIDVGISRLNNKTLVGDVDFASAKDKAAWITPVPGGVGPITIATLLENTMLAFTTKEGK